MFMKSHTEAGATLQVAGPSVRSIKELQQTGHKLIFGFSVTQPTVATEAPAEDPLLGV